VTAGFTLDTGALVALERRDRRMTRFFDNALLDRRAVTVPLAVVAEWWRARSRARESILRAVRVEIPDLALAQTAGEALAVVGAGPSIVDAMVMASAARRGDIVFTGDFGDLSRLQSVFRTVRLLAV
jgi:hypothetical protein